MDKFINKIAKKIYHTKRHMLDELIFVLPSKRTGIFFKQALSNLSDVPLWVPKIYSIEEWLEELSGFTIIDKTPLLFEMYLSYQSVFPKDEQDSFDVFLKWAPMLLKDFNDIDSYLDQPQKLFNYIHQAKKIETWTPLGSEPSDMVKKYLRFWELMALFFADFKTRLEEQNIAFQGMAYRKASGNISKWIAKNNPLKSSIFYLGFNAMNPCETHIMRTLIAEDIAEVFWDADEYYLKDKKQEAGKYLRKYQQWPEFDSREFNWVCSELKKKKTITVFGAPKGVAQAQLAGSLLDKYISKKHNLKDIALILADEKMLLPVLEFLPKSVNKLNITMGSSLRNTNFFSFFDALFQLHINREKLTGNKTKFYFQDLFKIWQQPVFHNSKSTKSLEKLKNSLQEQNLSFPSKEDILNSCVSDGLPWVNALLNYQKSNHHPLTR